MSGAAVKVSGLYAIALAAVVFASAPLSQGAAKSEPVCAACVKATMEKLAGDELRGRQCGGPDENAAARYLAGALHKLGVQGGLPDGGYLQTVQIVTPTYAAPPALDLTNASRGKLHLVNGQEMVLQGAPPASLDAPVIRVADAGPPFEPLKGKVVIFDGRSERSAIAATLQKSGRGRRHPRRARSGAAALGRTGHPAAGPHGGGPWRGASVNGVGRLAR